MTQCQRRALKHDLRPLLQRAARNRDIILRRRQPPDTFKCNWTNCRHSSPLSHRPRPLAAQYHFPEGRFRSGELREPKLYIYPGIVQPKGLHQP